MVLLPIVYDMPKGMAGPSILEQGAWYAVSGHHQDMRQQGLLDDEGSN